VGEVVSGLTARGVKVMLARAGVDYSALTITDDPGVWVDIETGQQGTSVKVEGPRDVRQLAGAVLYGRGLGNAPYPGYDMWSRR
jgi:hypothetical protein